MADLEKKLATANLSLAKIEKVHDQTHLEDLK
jgi:hypothetical protein